MVPSDTNSASRSTPLRVLVVEDSELDARILINLLRGGGWSVTYRRVESAEALQAALSAEAWDFVLADHQLPGFSAPEALRVVQRSAHDIPFIIVSGGIEEGVAIAAMKAGAHDFLMKGALGRLVPAVQRELRDAASRAARRRAEADLQQSELRYRSVWENSTDAVLLLDLAGVIRFANPASAAVFGWAPEQLAGQTLDALQPTSAAAGEWWRQARNPAVRRCLEVQARKSDGSTAEVEIAITEMRMKEELWVVAFCRDIAERRRAEAELQKNREEFAAAAEIQQRLFPASAPVIPGYDLAGVSRPAEAAGGDYYNFLPLPDGSWAIVVADVSGHGVGPALLMAEARAYLRYLARYESDPGTLLTQANGALAEDLGTERYITMHLARLVPETRVLEYASAGHPPTCVLGADGQLKASLRRTGPPLGRRPDLPCSNGPTAVLQPGDIVLFLTDGLDEATNPAGTECFGIDRALDVLRQHRHRSAAELAVNLCDAVRRFVQPGPQQDDLTVVVLKVV